MTPAEAREFLGVNEETLAGDIKWAYHLIVAEGIKARQSWSETKREQAEALLKRADEAYRILGFTPPEPVNLAEVPLRKRVLRAWSDSISEWASLFGVLSFNKIAILFVVPMIIIFIPAYFLFIPLKEVIWPGRRCSDFVGIGLVASALLCGAAVAYSPVLLVRSLEQRYGTDKLCEVCGRPGTLVEYRSDKEDASQFRVFCPEHLEKAPKSIDISAGTTGATTETPGNGASSTAFYCSVLLVVSAVGAFSLAKGDYIKATILLYTSLIAVGVVAAIANQEWLNTLQHPEATAIESR